MPAFQLVRINGARLAAPLRHPQIADLVADLAPTNALAERSEGFVWRLEGESGDLRSTGDDRIGFISPIKPPPAYGGCRPDIGEPGQRAATGSNTILGTEPPNTPSVIELFPAPNAVLA